MSQNDCLEHSTAETLFKRAVVLQPDNVIALVGLASVMENLHHDFDAAEQLYQRVSDSLRQPTTLSLS